MLAAAARMPPFASGMWHYRQGGPFLTGRPLWGLRTRFFAGRQDARFRRDRDSPTVGDGHRQGSPPNPGPPRYDDRSGFHPRLGVLVTSGDSAIRLWNTRSRAEILPDRGHTTGIASSVLLTGRPHPGHRKPRQHCSLVGPGDRQRTPPGSESGHGTSGRDIGLSPNGAIAAYDGRKASATGKRSSASSCGI